MLVRVVERTAHAHLNGMGCVNKPFLERTTKRRTVVVLFPEDLVAKVGMGIEMKQRHRAMLLRDRAQLTKRDGMVAAQYDGHGAFVQNARHARFDSSVGRVDVARHDGKIAHVAAAQILHDIHLLNHVVRLDHGGNRTDSLRPEARPCTVRARRVERHACDGEVKPARRFHARHPHERTGVAEARRGERACWLGGFGHRASLSRDTERDNYRAAMPVPQRKRPGKPLPAQAVFRRQPHFCHLLPPSIFSS